MIPKGLKREIRSRFTELQNEVGVPIIIYTEPQKQDCPNCFSDHTGTSVGKHDTSFVAPVVIFGTTYFPAPFTRGRCSICLAKGYLEYEASTVINVIVRWNPPAEMSQGNMVAMPAGLEGKNVARVKAAKCYYDIIRDSEKALIDGIECVLHLPPVLRSVGTVDVMVTAFFVAAEVGHSVRDG